MAFKTITIRLPDEYIDDIKARAGNDDESQGFMVQQAWYAQSNGKLPPPRRRDRKKEEK